MKAPASGIPVFTLNFISAPETVATNRPVPASGAMHLSKQPQKWPWEYIAAIPVPVTKILCPLKSSCCVQFRVSLRS